jgi:hypothetical protein
MKAHIISAKSGKLTPRLEKALRRGKRFLKVQGIEHSIFRVFPDLDALGGAHVIRGAHVISSGDISAPMSLDERIVSRKIEGVPSSMDCVVFAVGNLLVPFTSPSAFLHSIIPFIQFIIS